MAWKTCHYLIKYWHLRPRTAEIMEADSDDERDPEISSGTNGSDWDQSYLKLKRWKQRGVCFLQVHLSLFFFFLIFLSAKYLLVTLKLWANASFPNIFHLTECNPAHPENGARHTGLCACTCLQEVTAAYSPAHLFFYNGIFTQKEKNCLDHELSILLRLS